MSRTSMTTLRDALFRIEPTRGLVSYTEDVKPYHTKILDVLIEYVYEERIDVTISEAWKWVITLSDPFARVSYACGYGIVWDNTTSADSNPPVTIVDISPANHRVLNIVPGSVTGTPAQFVMAGKVLGDFPTGSKFRVSDSTYSDSSLTIPSNITEFTVHGTPVYVNGRTTVQVSETILPYVGSVETGHAYAMVDRFDVGQTPPANSFLVSTAAPTVYDFMVSNLNSNQLQLADRTTIVGVSPSAHTWTISGNKVDDIEVGMKVHVTSNHINANGMYTVTGVALTAGNTVITVYEPIFTTAIPSGYLAFPLKTVDEYPVTNIDTLLKKVTIAGHHSMGIIPAQEFTITGNVGGGDGTYIVESVAIVGANTVITTKNTISASSLNTGVLRIERLPGWVSGTEIKLSGTGVQPAPLSSAGKYYFLPTPTPGVFNLGYKRYPTSYTDVVNLTTRGVGNIKVSRGELYYPGAVIKVDHTFSHPSRGMYYIKSTVTEGPYIRVYVMQHINAPHGGTSTIAGTMTNTGSGYDEPSFCPLASAGGLYTDTYIHEHLQFSMEVFKRDSIRSVVVENQRDAGWGVSPLSRGNFGPYGTDIFTDVPARYALTSGLPPMDGAHVLLPTGYDTQLWDIGGMCEGYVDVQNFHGRTLP